MGIWSFLKDTIHSCLSSYAQTTLCINLGIFAVSSLCVSSFDLTRLDSLFGWNCFWWISLLSAYSLTLPSSDAIITRNIPFVSAISNVAVNTVIITLIPFIYTQYASHASESMSSILLSMLVFNVIESILFYCVHRLLHCQSLYKRIHSIHHQVISIHPFYSQYQHPVETLLNSMTILISMFYVDMSLKTVWILTPILISTNIQSHTYENGRHALHHKYFNCNYGIDAFTDKLFGTNREFEVHAIQNFNVKEIKVLSHE